MCAADIISIDGPAGSGKTTLGKMLAEYLGYLFFDTGVMYRAVTLAAIQRNLDVSDEAQITRLAERIDVDIKPPSQNDGRGSDVLLDGKDVTWEIRLPEVDSKVSIVSAYPDVRNALGRQQRRIGSQGKVVMIGRDIGTVILPEAGLKIYLDASVEERARRRYAEFSERRDAVFLEDILRTIEERDRIDTTRAVAPLIPARDAVLLDTDGLTLEEAFLKLIEIVERNCESHQS
jgi:cytidylate kinase